MALLTTDEVRNLAAGVNNGGRWDDDALGTLNLINPEKTSEAVQLIRQGTVVSCGRTWDVPKSSDDRDDSTVSLTRIVGKRPQYVSVNHRLEMVQHDVGSPTHCDSFGHFFYDGSSYNGVTDADRGTTGRFAHTVEHGRTGCSREVFFWTSRPSTAAPILMQAKRPPSSSVNRHSTDREPTCDRATCCWCAPGSRWPAAPTAPGVQCPASASPAPNGYAVSISP